METQTWRKGDIVGDGRFEILKELGSGGFGITYLAYDKNKKQQVAIKTLNSNQQKKDDFIQIQAKLEDEAFILRGFRHSNIVRVYEKVIIDGLIGFVMEYIPGQNLEKYVETKGRLEESEALRYIDQISQALDYVHQDKVFHRDVNPRNIMLRQDSQEAVLIDFGLAREFVELEPIYLSNTHGSELYKPVEQYEKRGVFGPPTDIYALAVTLYYLLNGGRLGNGKSNWIAYTSISRKTNYGRGLGEEADRELWAELTNVGVSAKTLAAIQAGMSIEPEQRPQNMTKFRELLGFVSDPTIQPDPSSKDIPELSLSPIETTPNSKSSPPNVTASILGDEAQDFSETSIPSIETTPTPEKLLPNLTASMPGEDLPNFLEPLFPPVVVNPPPDLTASIPTVSKPVADSRKPSDPSVQNTTAKKENSSPSSTASNSVKSKPTEELHPPVEPRRRSAEKQDNRSTLPQARSQPGFTMPDREKPVSSHRKKKNPSSSIGRRFILGGLVGTGGLAGFGFVGLLLKNLLEPQSQPKPFTQANTAFALETVQFVTVKLDNQGKIIARPQGTAQIYKEDLGSGTSLTMVKIPAGSFLMGSPVGEKNSYADEKPQHKVTLEAFYLGQTEVTQAQYQAIMGSNPSHFKGAKLPVEQVSWLDAKEFCKRLSQKTGKVYDLPSESQWEYACRAGSTTPFAFGDTITTDVANYDGNHTYGKAPKGIYRQKTTAVTTFPPNAFGLFDMHGNVWEWCADIWHDSYNGAPTNGGAWNSGNDNDSQLSRLLRGGSWYCNPRYCRSAGRDLGIPDNQYFNYGFRVCLAVPRT